MTRHKSSSYILIKHLLVIFALGDMYNALSNLPDLSSFLLCQNLAQPVHELHACN